MSQTAAPLVGVVMGSDSDWPVMQAAACGFSSRARAARRTCPACWRR